MEVGNRTAECAHRRIEGPRYGAASSNCLSGPASTSHYEAVPFDQQFDSLCGRDCQTSHASPIPLSTRDSTQRGAFTWPPSVDGNFMHRTLFSAIGTLHDRPPCLGIVWQRSHQTFYCFGKELNRPRMSCLVQRRSLCRSAALQAAAGIPPCIELVFSAGMTPGIAHSKTFRGCRCGRADCHFQPSYKPGRAS